MASITYELNGNEITVLLQDDETDSIKLQRGDYMPPRQTPYGIHNFNYSKCDEN